MFVGVYVELLLMLYVVGLDWLVSVGWWCVVCGGDVAVMHVCGTCRSVS
jgi:hypothetical protein